MSIRVDHDLGHYATQLGIAQHTWVVRNTFKISTFARFSQYELTPNGIIVYYIGYY